VGGAVTVLVIVWVKKHPLAKVVDAFGPALAVSYIFGRIGCFLSGDGCYGKPSDLPWAMSFPNGMVPTTARVHLTPLYEVVLTLGIFYVLKRMEWRSAPAGSVFWAYVGLASLERFLTGFTRTNPDVFLGLSAIQLISLVGMALTFVMMLRFLHVEQAFKNA
jgi:phosphatidylglycerol:prolipoprotein diacylglycerol transferase